ncbi:hypothetical protein GCM10019060_39530 [Novosphingobium pokkalii]|nr:hypothetical protein GCM10019060_39530 [Novosphingobium pokkalii]
MRSRLALSAPGRGGKGIGGKVVESGGVRGNMPSPNPSRKREGLNLLSPSSSEEGVGGWCGTSRKGSTTPKPPPLKSRGIAYGLALLIE